MASKSTSPETTNRTPDVFDILAVQPTLVTTSSPENTASRPHFPILDGLRGVAALSVVTFHFMEIAIADYSGNFIAHGFLAVDFFFCLSGFVIAYAYDNRIGRMGTAAFFRARLIRLHPLVLLGSALGLLTFYVDPFGGDTSPYSSGRMLLIFLCSVFLVPFPVMADRYFNLFGLNAPSWSLFWEYIANIFYALILSRLKKTGLLLLAAVAAVWLGTVAWRSHSLIGGWDGKSFWDGGARIGWSFLAGMIIFRFNLVIRNRLGFAGLAGLLMLAFVMPYNPNVNWITEPLVVLLFFPFIVMLGTGAVLSDRMKRICDFSGRISYPLYMTHYAFMWAFGHYYAVHKPAGAALALIIVPSLLFLLGIAWLAMTFYDIPVRKYLGRQAAKA